MTALNLISFLGLLVLAGLAWVVGGLKRPIAWRTVSGSGLLMLTLGTVVFLLPPNRRLLLILNEVVVCPVGSEPGGSGVPLRAAGTQFRARAPQRENPRWDLSWRLKCCRQ